MASTQTTAPARQDSGSTLRTYVEYLKRRGMLEKVKAAVGPETARLLERPPLATSWIDSALVEEVYTALERLEGLDGVRRITFETTQQQVGSVVGPLVSGLMRMFGRTPATLFGRLDSLCRMFVRGASYEWLAQSPTSGTIVVRYVEPAPQVAYVAWEGIFRVGLELCGCTGTVASCVVAPDRLSGRYAVRWTAKGAKTA